MQGVKTIRIKHYSHKLEIADLDEGLMGDATEMERHLMDSHDLIQTRGKIAGLFKIGGTNNRDTAKNILERLMSNDVMSKFNMKGKKGKFAFRKLRIHQVIIESMLKEGVTEFDIDQDVAYCLKYAPDRRGGGGRKKEQDTPN